MTFGDFNVWFCVAGDTIKNIIKYQKLTMHMKASGN